MRVPDLLDRLRSRDMLKLVAAQLMLGFFIGYLFFHDIFYYYTAPFDSPIPSWSLVLFFGLSGILVGYLFPDVRIALASSVTLPVLGALFCFLIFISPVFSRDIISSNLSDELFLMARYLLVDVFLSFLVIFVSGFISVYFFDEGYDGEDPFSES